MIWREGPSTTATAWTAVDYLAEGAEPISQQQLTERCRTFVETCGEMFYCSVSCSIGDPCPTELVPYLLPAAAARLAREGRTLHYWPSAVFVQ